jgi:hypothetical protein
MRSAQAGPSRSRSIRSYLWRTRAIAAVAGLAVVAAIASDVLAPGFWTRHPLLAGLTASFVVVVLTVAVVNEAIEWRNRRRWSVLAQYVMLDFVRHARFVWMGVAEATGILPPESEGPRAIERGGSRVRNTAQLTASIEGLIARPGGRRQLQDLIARLAERSDDSVGRWAAVMLNTAAYAEIVDRHVELASSLSWLQAELDNFEPPEDRTRHRTARAHPVAQFGDALDDETLTRRVVGITQLAERLDRSTLLIAERLVPREWWDSHLMAASQGDRIGSSGDVSARRREAGRT